MEKPYDIKDLGKKIVEEAKAHGLTLAEETAEELGKSVYSGLKAWLKESSDLTPNPLDNVVYGFIGHLDSVVLPQIEKLDLDGDGD